ncbi:uncharacterized protein N7473_011122 [Penicillium subrubescens]|nr:uncharacterized protein N7473_011122 [Penicillium subrubescens]KAJ5882688.1 hypothetical protein N7473_011122 [Penicillium subrubescens]
MAGLIPLPEDGLFLLPENDTWAESSDGLPEASSQESESETDGESIGGDRELSLAYSEQVFPSAVEWIERYMGDEPACYRCRAPGLEHGSGWSMKDMAAWIRQSGLPDILNQSISDPLPPPHDPLWKTVLTGDPSVPPLSACPPHAANHTRNIRFDIDALIAEARSLAVLRELRFSYHPKPMHNVQKSIHVLFHGKQLHQCRHIRFAEGLHDQHLWLYIAFPRLECSRETYLTKSQHALWIDQIVLPSLREVMPPTYMQHLPLTWAHGAAKMRAKHNEHRTRDVGGTDLIPYAIKEEYLSELWERMRAKLIHPSLAEFRGMFIVVQTYGTKLVWNHENFTQLRNDFCRQLSSLLNLAYLDESKTYVDIGKECLSGPSNIHCGNAVVYRTGSVLWVSNIVWLRDCTLLAVSGI